MEPQPHMLEYLLGPAMPYLPDQITLKTRRPPSPEQQWETSSLNPKNRIDSGGLAEQESGWRFFRADLIRRRLAVVPLFALGHPPQRIDVHLAADVDLNHAAWKQQMSLTELVLMDRGCQDSLLAQHVAKALGYWSRRIGGFAERYMKLPFASRIVVRTLTQDVMESDIVLDGRSYVETQWASAESLRISWNIPKESWPAEIDIGVLSLVSELHESVTLVSTSGCLPEGHYALKSSTSQPKYLYHELKQLLSMESHPNIMPKPLAIVTKKVQFGSKRGVCGLLFPYYPAGNLARALRTGSAVGSRVDCETKFRWVFQIASALLHIRSSPMRYYSDLKLDNIMLVQRGDRHDVVLIDFEQRGAWFSWSPPEINRIAHAVYLADNGNPWVPPAVREKFRGLCQTHLPTWQARSQRRRPRYTDKELGYNVCWQTLGAEERERAMSFMFGRVLWCIFEGQASPNAAEFLGAEIFRETNTSHRFPETRRTPPEIKGLIQRCTSMAPEWEGERRCVERHGDVVYPAGRDRLNADMAEEDTISLLGNWWVKCEMEAERYIKQRSTASGGEGIRRVMRRPGMAEIVDTLRQFGERHGLLGVLET